MYLSGTHNIVKYGNFHRYHCAFEGTNIKLLYFFFYDGQMDRLTDKTNCLILPLHTRCGVKNNTTGIYHKGRSHVRGTERCTSMRGGIRYVI